MQDHTYKVIELVGSSPDGVDAAIRNAVERAGKTLRHLDWFEVEEVRGRLDGDKIGWFQVKVGIGFRVEEDEDMDD